MFFKTINSQYFSLTIQGRKLFAEIRYNRRKIDDIYKSQEIWNKWPKRKLAENKFILDTSISFWDFLTFIKSADMQK